MESESEVKNNKSDKPTTFLSKLTSGPIGLGDPQDRYLRKVEREVMIPKIVRERSKTEKCAELKKAFDQCCLDNALMMVVKCRDENRKYQECMNRWFFDENFVSECKEIYLQQRAEFRTTGIKRNNRQKPKPEQPQETTSSSTPS